MAKTPSKGSGQPKVKIEIDRELSPQQREELLKTLRDRFEKNTHRHPGLEWSEIQAKLEAHPEKLASLGAMERTGGEPDVVGRDPVTGEFIFYDCSAESPSGRRSICSTEKGRKKGRGKAFTRRGTLSILQPRSVSRS